MQDCREELPIEVTVQDCREELPIEVTVQDCREELPIEVTVQDCREELPIEVTVQDKNKPLSENRYQSHSRFHYLKKGCWFSWGSGSARFCLRDVEWWSESISKTLLF